MKRQLSAAPSAACLIASKKTRTLAAGAVADDGDCVNDGSCAGVGAGAGAGSSASDSAPSSGAHGSAGSAVDGGSGANGDSVASAPRGSPLDLSDRIPVSSLSLSAMTLHEFASAYWPQILATGLARIAVPCDALRPLVDTSASLALLESVLGKSFKMNCYAYAFVEVSPGHYKLKYKRSPPNHTPSKFAAIAAEAAKVGAFAGLPTTGDFSDDAYWAAVQSAAMSGETIVYPSDIHASLLRNLPGMPVGWNMAKFDETNDLLRAISPFLGSSGGIIEGYTTPMLYVGAPGTTFALHSEDQNLFSCNFLVAGAPKVWYSVPSFYYCALIAYIHKQFAKDALVKECPQAVMHKVFLVTPSALRAAGFPVSRMVQRAGDMMLTAPGSFHFGYNTGWNLAEASNFAIKEWWTGGHFHDSVAVGNCRCKQFKRFFFDDDDVREGLINTGHPFGIEPTDL